MTYNILDSITSALNPKNLLKKVGIILLFISVLGLDKLILNIDSAFKGEMSFGIAIYSAYKSALYRAFGTIYPVIIDFVTFKFEYLNNQAYGTLAFAGFFGFLLVYIFYQPVSLLFDLFDGQEGHGTSMLIRLITTIFVVILMSAFAYYVLGEHGINTVVGAVNETMNSTINMTNSNGGVPVISLI